jgi:hypothetical protein
MSKGFTKIPNWLLSEPNNLSNAEFRVLMCIYRWTTGYHRQSYAITYKKLEAMCQISAMSRTIHSLKNKQFIDCERLEGTQSYTISITEPITSSQQAHNIRSTYPLHKVNGSRRAKESIKENLKKDTLFDKFIKMYPEDRRSNDDSKAQDEWSKLSDEKKQMIVEVMGYQKEIWKDPNLDRKYIPYPQNYLHNGNFNDEKIQRAIRDKRARIKEKLDFEKRKEKSKENPASQQEIQDIFSSNLKKKTG